MVKYRSDPVGIVRGIYSALFRVFETWGVKNTGTSEKAVLEMAEEIRQMRGY